MPRVTWGVRGDKNRFNATIFDKFLQRWISGLAAAGFGQVGATVRNKITHSNDFDIGVILEAELGAELAETIANDANADLSIGDGLPTL